MRSKILAMWDTHIIKIIKMLRKTNISIVVSIYLTVSFAVLSYAGETDLTDSIIDFLWWAIVTASTVGYGDISPQSDIGKLYSTFVFIPCSIALFALVTGKFLARAANIWYRRIRGMHTTSFENHIVIIGFNSSRTPSLVEQISREEKRKIVLVSVEQTENPLPDQVEFIHVPSFTNQDEMERASFSQSDCIIVDPDTDEVTLTVALFAGGINPEARLVAHFEESIKGDLLKRILPNSECISNMSTELLAKSVIDSGSSLVHNELVSAHKGQTQYSMKVPEDKGVTTFKIRCVFMILKEDYEATVMGIRRKGEDNVTINPKLSTEIFPGDTIFYISDERINFEDWDKLSEPVPDTDSSEIIEQK